MWRLRAEHGSPDDDDQQTPEGLTKMPLDKAYAWLQAKLGNTAQKEEAHA